MIQESVLADHQEQALCRDHCSICPDGLSEFLLLELQEFRGQVLGVRTRHLLERLGAQGPRPRLPPGLLRVRRLPPPTVHGRGVRAARGPGAVQGALPGDAGRRHHVVGW